MAHGYRAVVAVGGDGTVGEVITGLAGTDVPVGIVAKGTANQVASNLGIPNDIESAVEVAVNGVPAPIDLGQLDDGRYFALAAGAGWDAAVMAGATRELKDRWGFGAYIYAGLRVGVKPPRHRFRIVADGREMKVKAAMVLLANMGQFMANTIPPVQVTVAPDVSYQDGKLDVCIFAPRTVADVATLALRVLRGRFSGDEKLIYFQASRGHRQRRSPRRHRDRRRAHRPHPPERPRRPGRRHRAHPAGGKKRVRGPHPSLMLAPSPGKRAGYQRRECLQRVPSSDACRRLRAGPSRRPASPSRDYEAPPGSGSAARAGLM